MFSLSILLFQSKTAAKGDEAENSQNLVDIITSGGPISIAIFSILLILSILALYIFIERWLTIKRATRIDDNFMNNIRAAVEIFKLEKGLSTLASISGAAPMIGFFGTVTGMIMAFHTMATAESVGPAQLAGGIYQALTTTAFGLLIGIISFVGYNLLVANVDKAIFNMERSTVDFMDLLQEPSA